MTSEHILLIAFLNKPELILHTIKGYQVFPSNTNYSICYLPFACINLNGYTNDF